MSKIDNETSLYCGWVEKVHENDVEVVELQDGEPRRRLLPREGLHLISGEFVQISHCVDESGKEVIQLVPEDTDWNPHKAAIA